MPNQPKNQLHILQRDKRHMFITSFSTSWWNPAVIQDEADFFLKQTWIFENPMNHDAKQLMNSTQLTRIFVHISDYSIHEWTWIFTTEISLD